MAVTARAAGTWENGATGLTADEVVAVPAAQVTGDMMLLIGVWKAYSTTASVSGWTELFELADGTVAAGSNVGSVKVGVWYKIATSDAESDPTLDFSVNPAPGEAVILVFQKASGNWAIPTYVVGAINTWGTGGGSTSASSTIAVPSGACVVGIAGIRDDTAAVTRVAASIDDSGGLVTWNGNFVEYPATHASTTTSNDVAADAGYRLVTTGAAGVTLRQSGTLSATETGQAAWVVLAEAPAVTGTGAGTGAASTAAGTGALKFTATGTGTGTAATASGTGKLTFTGTGAGTGAASTASGEGTVVAGSFTGTGAGIGAASTATGSGKQMYLASGAGTGVAATASGAAKLTFAATAAGTGTAAAASGTGKLTFTGTGVGVGVAATAAGTGKQTVAGTGAGAGIASTATGDAKLRFLATGQAASVAATAAGTGKLAFTGAGAGAGVAPSGAGTGVYGDAFVGSGAGLGAVPSGSGTGMVASAVVVIPGGSYLVGLRSRPIIRRPLRILGNGTGWGQRPSGFGVGIVSDDDLALLALEAA